MSIALKIESGPLANTLLPIKPGETFRIGRTEQADCPVPEDNFLSRVHFEVSDDGHSCRVRDLKSSNGTRLNGVPVSEAKLQLGDEIIAGQTRFSIHVERDKSKTEVPLKDTELAATVHGRLLTTMQRDLQPLYAVLDTAHEPSVFRLLLESKLEYAWIFEGEQACQLAHFAPYLVPLPPHSPFLPALVQNGWGKNWGIYLTSSAAPWELLAFLRRQLVTWLPDGNQALLRFYDPRVLRTLLHTSTSHQRQQFFGIVHAYVMEAEDPEIALGFMQSAHGLVKTELPLSDSRSLVTTLVDNESEVPLIPGRAINDSSANIPVVSKEQMAALDEVKSNAFGEAILEELRELFPIEFAGAGEWRMRALVQYGCIRPQRYGIRNQSEIRKYIKLMVQLGRNFDIDPELPWAISILGRRLAPTDKMDKLEAASVTHLIKRPAHLREESKSERTASESQDLSRAAALR
jgi:hypothetical protein